MPALKRHQHSTELLPGDLLAVNCEQGGVPCDGIVPIDSSAHRLFGDLRLVVFARKVLNGEHSAKLFNQSPKQPKQIVVGIAGDLTLIAGRVAIAQLERVHQHDVAQKTCPEVELVRLASAVDEPYWLDAEVLELVVPANRLVRKSATAARRGI